MADLSIEDIKLINEAMSFAINAHHETNHFYGESPYSVHLGMVANFGMKYSYLLPKASRANAIASCWTHDTIEDARQTFNNVKLMTNAVVATVSSKVTNYTRGINRDSRMPDWLYKEIHDDEIACFVKICDRMANIMNSSLTKDVMFEKYGKEHTKFKEMLYRTEYHNMFQDMEILLGLIDE